VPFDKSTVFSHSQRHHEGGENGRGPEHVEVGEERGLSSDRLADPGQRMGPGLHGIVALGGEELRDAA
jgi:hypothetical protein